VESQTAAVASPQPAPSLAGFTPAIASVISAEVSGRTAVDVEATISYRETTGFELIQRLVPAGPPTMISPLNDRDLRTLLGEIQTALGNPIAGLDTKALEAFADTIEGARATPPDLFAQARFGSATEQIFGGTVTVVGLVGIGVDVAATIHDTEGLVTWEHHVVPRPPGAFVPLTDHERDGLTAALSAWLEANPENPAWERILNDLER
jgi:hypothetical protein